MFIHHYASAGNKAELQYKALQRFQNDTRSDEAFTSTVFLDD